MDASTTCIATAPQRRDIRALERLMGLAQWVRLQASPFRFADVREAFQDHRDRSLDAAERMWSRDKRALAAAGIVLDHPSAVEYSLDATSFRRLASFTGDEVDVISGLVGSDLVLPPPVGFELEMGLRKLLALGAPIAGPLSRRESPVRASGPAQLLRAAVLLLPIVADADDRGISLDLARRLVGVLDATQLEDVARLLESMEIPDAAPPLDALGLEFSDGFLHLSMRAWSIPRLALTPGEVAALRLGASMSGHRGALAFLDRVAWRPVTESYYPTFAEIQALAA